MKKDKKPQIIKGNFKSIYYHHSGLVSIVRIKTGKRFTLDSKRGEVLGVYRLLKSLMETVPETATNKLGEQVILNPKEIK